MTQIGEGIAVIPPGGKEKCCFCGKDHQEKKAAPKAEFPRNMSKLKSEGRTYSIANYSSSYPGVDKAPLIEWQSDINSTGGYKAAAHHCIALKCASKHEISGELKAAGYDPNRGSNCSWLPFSSLQFSRARAYNKALQKHSGGHTEAYFTKVDLHIDQVAKLIKNNFCDDDKQGSKDELLEYMLMQEKAIWNGLAKHKLKSYHLYNHSYLDPSAPWGAFPAEIGKTPEQLIDGGSVLLDDQAAEAENANDPE